MTPSLSSRHSLALLLVLASPACATDRPPERGPEAPQSELAATPALGLEPAPAPAPAGDEPCTRFAPPSSLGRVKSPDLVEISGLAASRARPGVLYVHNDSGDRARFFAVDTSGKTLAEFALEGATFLDCEDMTLGSTDQGSFLYLGDIGDNAARTGEGEPRSSIQIYRVREPDVSPEQAFGRSSIADWEKLDLVYPDRPQDAEVLMFDPRTLDLIVVTKHDDGSSVVFRAPSAPFGGRVTLEKLASLKLGGILPGASMATSGDIAPAGDRIAIRTYSRVLLFSRGPAESLRQAFGRLPNPVPAPVEQQGEALAFAADGRSYLTISEGAEPVIHSAVEQCATAR